MADKDNVLRIKADDFTIGEIEMIEEVGGQPIGWMGKEDKPQGKMMVAIAFVMGRRTNPDYSLEQARQMRIEVEEPEEVPDKGESNS